MSAGKVEDLGRERLLPGQRSFRDAISARLDGEANSSEILCCNSCVCLAAPVFPCIGVDAYLEELHAKYGSSDDDELFMDKEFCVFHGVYHSTNRKVELEDTEDDSGVLKELAHERIQQVMRPMLPVGICLWLFVNLGFVIGFHEGCQKKSTPLYAYVLLAFAGALQFWFTNDVVRLLGSSSFEGRPFVRLLTNLSGMDNYYILIVLSFTDLAGKYTRAIFVGQALKCGGEISEELTVAFEGSHLSFLAPVVGFFGFGGLSAISFAVFAVIVPVVLMLSHLVTIRGTLAASRQRSASKSNGIEEIMDDIGAVANWALLKPVGKVLSVAAVPLEFEDHNDLYRFWDRIVTDACVTLVNIMPDAVFQTCLQVRYVSYNFECYDFWGIAGILFSVGCSMVTALKAGTSLLSTNLVITVIAGGSIYFFLIGPVLRIMALFTCESHVLNLSSFSCEAAFISNITCGGN